MTTLIPFKSIAVLSSESSSEYYGGKRYITASNSYDVSSVYNHLLIYTYSDQLFLYYSDSDPFGTTSPIKNQLFAEMKKIAAQDRALNGDKRTIKCFANHEWERFLSTLETPKSESIFQGYANMGGANPAVRFHSERDAMQRWNKFNPLNPQQNIKIVDGASVLSLTDEARRKVQEEAQTSWHQHHIMKQRCRNNQCIYCGKGLSFLDGLLSRRAHKGCKTYGDSL